MYSRLINLGAVARLPFQTTGSAPQDVAVRIDFVAEDAQFGVSRGWGDGEGIANFEGEAGSLADLIKRDAGMKTEDLHPSGRRVKAENSQVGDDPIRAGSGR